ncbi:MAG: CapA family protein, partial [Candidatus Saccharibacteria bacterium]|nr:CapA family protein [Candidatus Saccharibacteria bacterium]
MRSIEYGLEKSSRRSKHRFLKFFIAIALLAGGYFGYRMFTKPSPQEVVNDRIVFDDSFTTDEKQKVSDAIVNQSKKISGITTAQVQTVESLVEDSVILDGYALITAVDSPKQQITKIELSTEEIFVWHEIDSVASTSIIKALGINDDTPEILNDLEELNADTVAIVPIGILSKDIKLLALEGNYYLDDFASGAVFRQVTFSGDSKELLSDLKLSTLPSKETTYKVNQTGVTALTRIMMKKLNSVGDPLYFSEKIGDFLADADLTHVSNEVSFRDDCAYSNTAFCSDPRFIETLKDSGVDLVELTGNHNNDVGSQYNTNTINLYRSIGWSVFGGGLNTEDASKFFVTD